jgi:predicted transcriptional regulator
MVRLSDEQREPFRKAAEKVEAKFVEMTGEPGKKVLNALQEEIKTCEQSM